MNRRLLPAIIFLLSVSACAQFPDKFTNLQVLPKDIGKDDLMQTMRNFSFATGLRCEGCHVQKPDKEDRLPRRRQAAEEDRARDVEDGEGHQR